MFENLKFVVAVLTEMLRDFFLQSKSIFLQKCDIVRTQLEKGGQRCREYSVLLQVNDPFTVVGGGKAPFICPLVPMLMQFLRVSKLTD